MMRWNRIKLAGAVVLPVIMVLVLGVVLVQGADNKPAASVATQPASQPAALGPKDVVLLAYRSALKGDATTMTDLFDHLDDEQKALIQKVANVFGAVQELNSAVAEKFGQQMADQIAESIGMGVNPKEMREGVETITGDTAIVDVGKSGPGKIQLVKVGSQWKLSSEVLRTMNRNQVAQTEQLVPMIQALAADVRDGKYTTAEQLQRAMGEMMRQMRGQPRR